ncbi:major capsid protein [Microvirus mar17]|uniref:Major capsid protein n=1 Tax=Microvirus mar17 TaxID=2851149 RepID=A0A8F5RAW0_9VIRU|nr:major capsid protein [Microvirus mar17]
MNPNNVNRFASAAVGVTRARSKFLRPSKHLTTFNSGKLIPLYVDEVLPGDNMKIKFNAVCRMATPLNPVMDNAYLDVYAFFVPNRLVWDHWKEFQGENNTDFWTQKTEYQVPQIYISDNTDRKTRANSGDFDVFNYLGIQPNYNANSVGTLSVSALPSRAYVKIWNDWFRDENVDYPCHLYTDDTSRPYDYGTTSVAPWVTGAELGGGLCPVNKFKDYFTSCLPSPQKGNAVSVSLGEFAPVVTTNISSSTPLINQSVPLRISPTAGGTWSNDTDYIDFFGQSATLSDSGSRRFSNLVGSQTISSSPTPNTAVAPSNLYTDLSSATAITVNQLRTMFQTQKYMETLARGGSRYIETLYSMFGVKASDKTLQRSQYLGGKRIPIEMTQVAQTSSDNGESPLGNVAAFSLTGFSEYVADSFFEEHGFLMIVGCVRTDQTYAQGVERFWFRKNRFDYYYPVFANLGEQAVLNREIYYDGSVKDTEVFGYQEAWAEYRYKPNRASALMNPNATNGLGAWSYVNKFASLPVLNDAFLRQSPTNVNQTISLSSDLAHQFICDMYIENESVRVMPMYSVPGLIDHA